MKTAQKLLADAKSASNKISNRQSKKRNGGQMHFQMIHECEFENAVKEKCSVSIKKIPNEAQKIFRIGKSQVFVLYRGQYYASITQYSVARGHKICLPTRTSRQDVKEFANNLRKEMMKYSSVSHRNFYLWNQKLFVKYCKKTELKITQTGNTLFGDWWSLDVRSHHPNLKNTKFTRKNFEKEMKKAQKWVDSKKKKINFFYPKIKWYVEEVT